MHQSKEDQWYPRPQVPLGFRSTPSSSPHKRFAKTKSEESGYDSDTTRSLNTTAFRLDNSFQEERFLAARLRQERLI